MTDVLFQNSLAAKIILNTFFISIPEELYAVMFTLIMVGEFEYWKEPECKRLINRFDYVRVFLPTVVGALLSNILINTGLNYGLFQFISPVVTYIIIVITNDIFGDASAIKWMLKAFIFFLFGFLSIGIFEFTYVPFVLYSTGLSIEEIKSNLFLYFMLALPSRFIQYLLLTYLVSKRRSLIKGNLIKILLSSPVVTAIFSVLIFVNILFLQMLGTAIIFDKMLIPLSHISQALIITGVVMFPIINISGFVWCVCFLKNAEIRSMKNAAEKLTIMLKEIEIYTNNEKYDNIRWKLNEIGVGIEDVAQNLYKENKSD